MKKMISLTETVLETTVSEKTAPSKGTTPPKKTALAKKTKEAQMVSAGKRAQGIALALVSGLAMSTQSRINGELGAQLHDSLLGAVLSFGSGLVLLLCFLLFSQRMRTGVVSTRLAVKRGSLRLWHCFGGVGGAMFVAAQSITVAILGVAVFTVGLVAGQTLSSLFVDRAGLGPAGPQPLTASRVIGAALTMVAVAASLSGGLAGAGQQSWMLILPLIGGVMLAIQQAINGRVGVASGSAFTAALVNFVVGTAALVLAWLISLIVRGSDFAGLPTNPVLYLGGLIGVGFIALAALVVRWIGVLIFGLSAIAGQLIGSLLLDVLLPASGHQPTVSIFIGTAIALVAILVAMIPSGRRLRGRRGVKSELQQSVVG